MQTQPKITIVELLGDAELMDPCNFHGQHALKATLLKHTQAHFRWHYVGHAEKAQFSSRFGYYHQIPRDARCPIALTEVINGINSHQKRIPIVCSYPVQSYRLIDIVLQKKAEDNRIVPVIVLHSTSQELLPALFGGGQTISAVGDVIKRAMNSGAWIVYVSEEVRNSFECDIVSAFMGCYPKNRQIIPNAIDLTWLTNAKELGIIKDNSNEFVVGCFAGFKPYKGKDILKSIIEVTSSGMSKKDWRFAFSALPNYGTRDLLSYLDENHQSLVSSGIIRLFVDVSQWEAVCVDIKRIAEDKISRFRCDLPTRLKACFDCLFRGVSTAPVHKQMSVQIRPSLHEAFGRAPVESLALGVPVISSNRDALSKIVPKEWQVAFPAELTLAAATATTPSSSYLRACSVAANSFIDKIDTIQKNSTTNRGSLIQNLCDSYAMVNSYKTLFDQVVNS